eukprot:scpid52749/ scgid6357/ 
MPSPGGRISIISVSFCQALKGEKREEALKHITEITQYYSEQRNQPVTWNYVEDAIFSVQSIHETAAVIRARAVTEGERCVGLLITDDSNRGVITQDSSQQSNSLQPVYDALRSKTQGLCVLMRDEMSKFNTLKLRSENIEDQSDLSSSIVHGDSGILLSIWQSATIAQAREFASFLFSDAAAASRYDGACDSHHLVLRKPAPQNGIQRWTATQMQSADDSESQMLMPTRGCVRMTNQCGQRPQSVHVQRVRIHKIIYDNPRNGEYQNQVSEFFQSCVPCILDCPLMELQDWHIVNERQITGEAARRRCVGSQNSQNVAILLESADFVHNSSKLNGVLDSLSAFDLVVVGAAFDDGFLRQTLDAEVSSELQSKWNDSIPAHLKDKLRLVSWWTVPSQAVAEATTTAIMDIARVPTPGPGPDRSRLVLSLLTLVMIILGAGFILTGILVPYELRKRQEGNCTATNSCDPTQWPDDSSVATPSSGIGFR